ncbi:unnamed protein product [Psylliodes chrysocephalus]|uniref:Regulatory protein zeste n=1 Tax=Psylliodes chrysocephalus TaxID=3402493 RepID=A0A9P0CH42_9CUCU|nr:unnamed protein product [Psylliodes chrysocephala]
MSDFGKRKRESNFSANEKQLLVSIISKYAHIIEDKKTDRTSMDTKNEAWKCIETEFNSSNADGIYRKAERLKKFFCNKKHDIRILKAEKAKLGYLEANVLDNDEHVMDTEIIKTFYDNEKKKVKKNNIEEKKFLNKTGCGKLPIRKLDDTEDVMLSIMNKKTIYGLTPHQFDSDNVSTPKIQVNENVEFEYLEVENNENQHSNYESDMDDDEEDNNCENKSNQSSKTPVRQNKSCSRRRPTEFVKVLSSSLFAEKYDLLLDRRLILSEKLIEELEEERVFKRKERKLKLELLQLEIVEKKQKK